jgi:hypothetical protein
VGDAVTWMRGHSEPTGAAGARANQETAP